MAPPLFSISSFSTSLLQSLLLSHLSRRNLSLQHPFTKPLLHARHCAQGLRVSFNPHNSPGGGEHHYYPAFIVSKQVQQLDDVASIPRLEDAEPELTSVPPGCVFLTPAIASSLGAGMLPPACCGHPVCLTQPTILGALGS